MFDVRCCCSVSLDVSPTCNLISKATMQLLLMRFVVWVKFAYIYSRLCDSAFHFTCKYFMIWCEWIDLLTSNSAIPWIMKRVVYNVNARIFVGNFYRFVFLKCFYLQFDHFPLFPSGLFSKRVSGSDYVRHDQHVVLHGNK